MFNVTHFRSEFINQGQATILRKVTMTQFMLVIIFTALAVGIFNIPYWSAPLFIVAGYVAGYTHHGEIVLKRVVAYVAVRGRSLAGAPRMVNVQAEWDQARREAEQQQLSDRFPIMVVVE